MPLCEEHSDPIDASKSSNGAAGPSNLSVQQCETVLAP